MSWSGRYAASGASARRWYFCISTCGPDKQVRVDSVTLAGTEPAAMAGRPNQALRVSHDEIAAARLCEAVWPGERITALRQTVEAEYHKRA
jgi:hypothetical protein